MKILIILAILVAAYLVYRAFTIESTELPLEPVVKEPVPVESEEEVIEETIPDDQFRKMLLIAAGIVLAISIAIAAALVL